MRIIKPFLVICSLILISACNAQSSPSPAPQPTAIIEVISTPITKNIPLTEADVPRITIENAKAAIESGAAIIVDVRSKEAFASSHIPGAINIFFQEFENNIAGVGLDKEQWIITYCT